jgi:PDZ domain-containing protein
MRILPTLRSLLAGFVRRTWLVTLVAVAVCGSFAAHAVAALSEEAVAESLSPHTAPVRRPPPQPPRAPLDSSILVVRNIFCSTCAPVLFEPGPTGHYQGEPATLIATALGLDPHAARATVRVQATDVQGEWALGDTIPGVGRIDRIGPTSIDVSDAHGETARLSLLEAKPAPASAAATADAQPKPDDPYAGRVKQLADGVYEVDRSLVRELVTGAAKPTGVRAIPVIAKDGTVAGIRMLGVHPGSVAAAIGLKSGDILNAIDGDQIKTAQQLLDLYAKLDQTDKVELQGTRAGKPLAVQLHLGTLSTSSTSRP